jgi:UDP-glucose:(heptosyl)LPS alpha-1,3-glucosyltransferase
MRIALSIDAFSRTKGGAEQYLVDLAQRLAHHGHEVHIFASRWDEMGNGLSFNRVPIIPFPKSLRLASFAINNARSIRGERFDIALGLGNTLVADLLQPHGGVHWIWFWRSLRAYEHPVLRGIKLVGRVLSAKQWVSGIIEDVPYRRRCCPRIIAISQMVKDDIVKHYGVPPEKVTLIYNGVDLERFHPENRRRYREEIRKSLGIAEELLILFVSNNHRMKGLNCLIKALARIRRDGESRPFKLLVLGRGPMTRYMKASRRLGFDEAIVSLQGTSHPERYYGAADFLVHPTFYDACSLAVFEALASGLPVITTKSNGAGGIITEGKEGFVVDDPRGIATLADRIHYFFDDRTREASSRAARELAERYPMEGNFQEMLKVFQEVATGKSP